VRTAGPAEVVPAAARTAAEPADTHPAGVQAPGRTPAEGQEPAELAHIEGPVAAVSGRKPAEAVLEGQAVAEADHCPATSGPPVQQQEAGC
jgi:hypothetical protein